MCLHVIFPLFCLENSFSHSKPSSVDLPFGGLLYFCLLEDNCFAMLFWFLLSNYVNLLYDAYILSFLSLPPTPHIPTL